MANRPEDASGIFTCPDCQNKETISLENLASASVYTCPQCGKKIDSREVEKMLVRMNLARDRLGDVFDSFNKRHSSGA
jgi:predicted RNA-binding Zn-ribbon protein involved in translation (DUF1610 family)